MFFSFKHFSKFWDAASAPHNLQKWKLSKIGCFTNRSSFGLSPSWIPEFTNFDFRIELSAFRNYQVSNTMRNVHVLDSHLRSSPAFPYSPRHTYIQQLNQSWTYKTKVTRKREKCRMFGGRAQGYIYRRRLLQQSNCYLAILIRNIFSEIKTRLYTEGHGTIRIQSIFRSCVRFSILFQKLKTTNTENSAHSETNSLHLL